MEFLSLPKCCQIEILKYVDWRSVIEVKFVCKNLNLLVEENIHKMERPKLRTLSIGFREQTNSDEIVVTYSIYGRIRTQNAIHPIGSLIKKAFIYNSECYENFFRSIDLTMLNCLNIRIGRSEEVTKSIDNLHKLEDHLRRLNHGFCGRIGMGIYDDASRLEPIKKKENIEHMSLMLDFLHQKIPQDFLSSKMNLLSHLCNVKKDEGKVITKEIILNLINSSCDDFSLDISLQDENIYLDVIRCCIEKVILGMEDRCDHQSRLSNVKFYKCQPLTLSDEEAIANLFTRYNFTIIGVTSSAYLRYFVGHRKCSQCRDDHSIRCDFHMFTGQFD